MLTIFIASVLLGLFGGTYLWGVLAQTPSQAAGVLAGPAETGPLLDSEKPSDNGQLAPTNPPLVTSDHPEKHFNPKGIINAEVVLEPSDQEILNSLDPRCSHGRAICVKKSLNRVFWIVDGKIRYRMDARFAQPGYHTPEGTFHIIRKSPDWVSTLYGTRMPYAMFFHAGYAVHFSYEFADEGYDGGSHGCVNVRDLETIKHIYAEARVGDLVIVAP